MGTPLRYRGEFASIHAACDAALAILGALHARLADGHGQRIDVSAQAATASILATAMAIWLYAGELPVKNGVRSVVPWGFFECADGFVLLQVTEDAQWFNLRRIIGEPEWAQPDVFDTTAMRSELQDVVHSMLAGELTRFTVDGFLDACQREGVAAARVQTATDLLAWPHLRARGYFTPIELPGGVSFEAPTPPWRYAGTPRPARRISPALGAHTAEVAAEWLVDMCAGRLTPAPTTRVQVAPAPSGVAPLAGLRAIDMTWVWAGPFAAMQFAHLGADVVKFESTSRVDVTRRLGPFADGEIDIDRSGYFNQYNQGKRSVVLDVKQPRGLALLKEIVATADLIIDNMRPGSLARLGLDMDTLRTLNPNIVAVAMSGFGEDGPERDRMAYGSIIDALSGVAASNGAPGGGPTDFPMSLPDPAAGIHAAIAAVAALYRVRRGGPGERVEVAMLEATLSAFPWPVLIEASGNGPVICAGNRDETMSPHGTYRCAGDDAWVAIAVPDDAAFARLAAVVGIAGSGDVGAAPGRRGRARRVDRGVDVDPDPRGGGRRTARRRRARRGGADDRRGGDRPGARRPPVPDLDGAPRARRSTAARAGMDRQPLADARRHRRTVLRRAHPRGARRDRRARRRGDRRARCRRPTAVTLETVC